MARPISPARAIPAGRPTGPKRPLVPVADIRPGDTVAAAPAIVATLARPAGPRRAPGPRAQPRIRGQRRRSSAPGVRPHRIAPLDDSCRNVRFAIHRQALSRASEYPVNCPWLSVNCAQGLFRGCAFPALQEKREAGNSLGHAAGSGAGLSGMMRLGIRLRFGRFVGQGFRGSGFTGSVPAVTGRAAAVRDMSTWDVPGCFCMSGAGSGACGRAG